MVKLRSIVNNVFQRHKNFISHWNVTFASFCLCSFNKIAAPVPLSFTVKLMINMNLSILEVHIFLCQPTELAYLHPRTKDDYKLIIV